jgi:hypothetical protein
MTHNDAIKQISDGVRPGDGGTPIDTGDAAGVMVGGGVGVGGNGMWSTLNSFCIKNRGCDAVILWHSGAAGRWQKRRGGKVTKAEKWSTTTTILFRMGQGSF